jgi:hypothetical protein
MTKEKSAGSLIDKFLSNFESADNLKDIDDTIDDGVDIDKPIKYESGKAGEKKLAEYKGQKVELEKPFRTPDAPKKFGVYVKNDKGNVVLVRFGDPNMEIKRDDPERRKNFRARHQCDTDPGPKWKAKYWSCKFWSDEKVGDLL